MTVNIAEEDDCCTLTNLTKTSITILNYYKSEYVTIAMTWKPKNQGTTTYIFKNQNKTNDNVIWWCIYPKRNTTDTEIFVLSVNIAFFSQS